MGKRIDVEIRETKNYAMFRELKGNRELKDQRVNKIIDSIYKVGYVLSPILVNEKYEVIDGQGRLEALKRLNMPVHYIMQEGIGVDECQQMNIHQGNWTLKDFIRSYAINGNKNYQRLQSLMDSTKLKTEIVLASVDRKLTDKQNNTFSDCVRNGNLILDEKKAENSKWELGYAERFMDAQRDIGGRGKPFYVALIFAYRNLDIDGREKLSDVVMKNRYNISAYSNTESFLKCFDGLYNKNMRKQNRVHLEPTWQLEQI